MRKIACMSRLFALAEPVPFTVPILNAKSLTRDARALDQACCAASVRKAYGITSSNLAHVPRGRRAALGAQAAVQADVLVLHHDALRLRQRRGDVDLLRRVERRRREMCAQIELVGGVGSDRQAIHRAHVDARVALDAQARA